MANSFSNVLERTISTLEAENSALRERRPYRIAELHTRKSMVLYEFDRLGSGSVAPEGASLERLKRLRELLDENRNLLRLNLAALTEVIETLQQVQIGEASDGTYSARSIAGATQR